MTNRPPELHVEGADDRSVVAALLRRHGVDTERGKKYLFIKSCENDEKMLDGMADAIRASTDAPVGFVLDIDIELSNRWDAVRSKLRDAGVDAPDACPPDGFVGKVKDYPEKAKCGVWLMPDCKSDKLKLVS